MLSTPCSSAILSPARPYPSWVPEPAQRRERSHRRADGTAAYARRSTASGGEELSSFVPNPFPQLDLVCIKHAYGGPEPFGVGQGIAQLEWQRLAPPLPPPPAEIARSARFAARQRVKALAARTPLADVLRPLRHTLRQQQQGQQGDGRQLPYDNIQLGQQQQQQQQQQEHEQSGHSSQVLERHFTPPWSAQLPDSRRSQPPPWPPREAAKNSGHSEQHPYSAGQGEGQGQKFDTALGNAGIARARGEDLLAGLSAEEAALVVDQKLRVILHRQWDLINELDRPWHRPLLLQLCLLSPPHTRTRYCQLKPSSLQRVIASRAKVEKALHELHQQALLIDRRTASQLHQVRSGGRVLSPASLQEAQELVRRMAWQLRSTRYALLQAQHFARHTLSDADYQAYAQHQLLPVVEEVEAFCSHYQEQVASHLAAASQINERFDGDAQWRRRIEALSELGQIERVGLHAYEAVTWRYPPAQWVRARRLGRAPRSSSPEDSPGLGDDPKQVPQYRLQLKDPATAHGFPRPLAPAHRAHFGVRHN